jgi:hypothetical protein
MIEPTSGSNSSKDSQTPTKTSFSHLTTGGGGGGGGGGGSRFAGKRDSLMLYKQSDQPLSAGGSEDKFASASRKEVIRLQKKTEGLSRENDKLQVIIENQTRELKELRQQLQDSAAAASAPSSKDESSSTTRVTIEDTRSVSKTDLLAGDAGGKRRPSRSSSSSKSKKRSKSGSDRANQERELLETCVYSAIAQWQMQYVDYDLRVISQPAKDAADGGAGEVKLTLTPTTPSEVAQGIFRSLLSWGLFADTSSDSFMKKFLRAVTIEHTVCTRSCCANVHAYIYRNESNDRITDTTTTTTTTVEIVGFFSCFDVLVGCVLLVAGHYAIRKESQYAQSLGLEWPGPQST